MKHAAKIQTEFVKLAFSNREFKEGDKIRLKPTVNIVYPRSIGYPPQELVNNGIWTIEKPGNRLSIRLDKWRGVIDAKDAEFVKQATKLPNEDLKVGDKVKSSDGTGIVKKILILVRHGIEDITITKHTATIQSEFIKYALHP